MKIEIDTPPANLGPGSRLLGSAVDRINVAMAQSMCKCTGAMSAFKINVGLVGNPTAGWRPLPVHWVVSGRPGPTRSTRRLWLKLGTSWRPGASKQKWPELLTRDLSPGGRHGIVSAWNGGQVKVLVARVTEKLARAAWLWVGGSAQW